MCNCFYKYLIYCNCSEYKMNSINEGSLRKLSSSELKKQAKKNGVKVNMTADKIRASLLEKSNADEDSFVTLERSILNSCKKNKEALFERDGKRMSETPRRDTYIVDTPSLNMQIINTSIVMESASPELKQSKDESLNVTMSRGSEKKNRKSKRKVSFVTPLRRSTRLSVATPHYNSVKGRPKTPMPSRPSSSKKRLSATNERNDSVVCNLKLDISETLDIKKTGVGKVKRPSTPMPLSKQKKKLGSFGDPHDIYKRCLDSSLKVILHRLKEEDLKEFFPNSTIATPIAQPDIEVKKTDTPCATGNKAVTLMQSSNNIADLGTENKVKVTPMQTGNKVATLPPGFKKIVTPFSKNGKAKSIYSTPRNKKTPQTHSSKSNVLGSLKKSTLTPGLTSSAVRKSPRSNIKASATPKLTSSAVKKTPNFSKLHQRAFEKMESISDYHQRKLVSSQKKKEEQNKFLNMAKSDASKQKKASMDKKLKKAPKKFGGIPFIPSAPTTKPLKSYPKSKSELKIVSSLQSKGVNGKSLAKKAIAGNLKAIKSVSRENTPLKQRRKFDLRASLAKKLPYKPHTGPLKPLSERSLNNTPLPTAQKVETKNVVLAKARIQTREVLHGVRKNKRFMLQMNNRNLDISMQ